MQFTYVLRRKKRWKKLQCRHTPLSLDCGPSFRNMERLIADILGMLLNITLSLNRLTFIHNRHLLVECSKQHQSVRIFCFFRPLWHPCWCTEESHQHSGCIHSLLSREKHTLAFNLTLQSAIGRSFQFFVVAEIESASQGIMSMQFVCVDSPKQFISFAGLVTGIPFPVVMIRLALSW